MTTNYFNTPSQPNPVIYSEEPESISTPTSETASRPGTMDSIAPQPTNHQRTAQGSTVRTSSTSSYTSDQSAKAADTYVDPLARVFPAPAEKIDLDEMLARKPRKWTLGHYIKEIPTGELASRSSPSPSEEKEEKSAALAAAKAELLAVKEELGKLGLGNKS